MATSTNVAVLGVTGTDGVIPVYNPTGIWQWWSIDDIWQGAAGANKFVPKVNDFVLDPSNYETYKVTQLDPVTLVPTLTPVTPSYIPTNFTPQDILFGVGPGTQADTYRMYVNSAVTPFVAAVDLRLYVGGTKASYAKIFSGSDLSSTGVVISMVYDASGNFVSQNVPLELVAIDQVTNYSWKTVSVFNIGVTLPDGEVVTAVFYDAQGNVVSKRQLLVENTNFIRNLSVSLKYVQSVSVQSPFLNTADPSQINFPLNVPINALNLTGMVSYSDGTSVTMPVDGTKFNVIGLQQYVSTIVGQQIPLVLSYALGAGEVAYNGLSQDSLHVTAPFTIVTTNPDNSYAVKIYGYPEWKGSTVGYIMRFFMVSLDRNIFFDVTPFVSFSTNTGTFNPQAYGYLQRKSISLNLSLVSQSFKPYIDTQLLDINLLQAPSLNTTPWTVSQVSGTDIPAYGQGLYAKISSTTNFTTADVSCGFTDETTWLENLYLATHPLINSTTETAAPTPTHFILMYGTQEYTYPVANWNQPLTINGAFTQYSNLYLRFINRTVSGDMILSVAGLIIYQES